MPKRRAALPLNQQAAEVANEKLWARYPELGRRQLTMSSADAKYRQFWMDRYLAVLPKQDPSPAEDESPDDPVAPCLSVTKQGCGKTLEHYQQLAEDKITDAGAGPLYRNKAITKAYADMYKSDPEAFKWAGMAAFASCEVGKGMKEAQKAQSGWRWVGGGLVGVSGKKLEKALVMGNNAVYADIYPQHLAYQSCGISELQKAYDEGKISDDVLEAWQKIDEGKKTGNQDLVWEGNKMLLKFEQREVLQPTVYDKDPMLWINVSVPPASWYQGIESPIPGDAVSFQDYYYLPYSIGDFDARWEWIEQSMLPKWKEVDATGLANVSEKMAPCVGL